MDTFPIFGEVVFVGKQPCSPLKEAGLITGRMQQLIDVTNLFTSQVLTPTEKDLWKWQNFGQYSHRIKLSLTLFILTCIELSCAGLRHQASQSTNAIQCLEVPQLVTRGLPHTSASPERHDSALVPDQGRVSLHRKMSWLEEWKMNSFALLPSCWPICPKGLYDTEERHRKADFPSLRLMLACRLCSSWPARLGQHGKKGASSARTWCWWR